MNPRTALRAPGVWTATDGLDAREAVQFVHELEDLGWSALWLPEVVGRDPFVHLAHLAAGTDRLLLGTGVAGIFTRSAGSMKQAAFALHELSGGRFVLGLGVSHRRFVTRHRGVDYPPPLPAMRDYLEEMSAASYSGPVIDTGPPVLIGALGPKMLALAAGQADGAMPYFATPAHTAAARAALGSEPLLCVEQKVVLGDDRDQARRVAAQAIDGYARTPNYRRNWLRLGFTDAEIDGHATAFVDALIPCGDPGLIRQRIAEHYAAGADHVCIQPLTAAGWGHPDATALRALAPAHYNY